MCDIDADRYHALLLQAQSAVDLAQGELDRTKANIDKGYVGKAMLDKAQLDFQNARVALLQAQSRCGQPLRSALWWPSCQPFRGTFSERHAGNPHRAHCRTSPSLEAVVTIPESEAFDYHEGQKAEFELLQGDGGIVSGRIRELDRAVEAHNRTLMARIQLSNTGKHLSPGMIGRVRILRKSYDKAMVLASQAVLRLHDGTAMMRG